jgi:hypothetical protein
VSPGHALCVELDAHAVILAVGLPAESYLNTGNRMAFVDGGDDLEAYPDFKPKHSTQTCMPLVLEGAAIARRSPLGGMRSRPVSVAPASPTATEPLLHASSRPAAPPEMSSEHVKSPIRRQRFPLR